MLRSGSILHLLYADVEDIIPSALDYNENLQGQIALQKATHIRQQRQHNCTAFLLKLWCVLCCSDTSSYSQPQDHSLMCRSASKTRLQVKRRFQHLILSCVKPLEDVSWRTEKQLPNSW